MDFFLKVAVHYFMSCIFSFYSFFYTYSLNVMTSPSVMFLTSLAAKSCICLHLRAENRSALLSRCFHNAPLDASS